MNQTRRQTRHHRIFLLFSLVTVTAIHPAPPPLATAGRVPPSPPSLTLTAVGDLVMHMPVVNSAFSKAEQDYNFRPIFQEIRPYLQAADLTVGVLETVLTTDYRRLSGYPRFNTPAPLADALRWAGFDLIFTAHNHSLDQGVNGIDSTLAALKAAGLAATGTRQTINEKPYYLTEINGLKLAFFSYTTLTNGLAPPPDQKWVLNTFNDHKIAWEILQLRKAGVDGIIMALHSGEEYQRYPSPADQKLYRRLFALGVDLILGSHVHVIRPLERVVLNDPFSNRLKTGLLAYSLGNFLSNQRWRYSDCGLMLTLRLQKKLFGPGLEIELLACVPLWVAKDRTGYRILMVPPPAQIENTSIPAAYRQKYHEVWADTESILVGWPGGLQQLQPPIFTGYTVK